MDSPPLMLYNQHVNTIIFTFNYPNKIKTFLPQPKLFGERAHHLSEEVKLRNASNLDLIQEPTTPRNAIPLFRSHLHILQRPISLSASSPHLHSPRYSASEQWRPSCNSASRSQFQLRNRGLPVYVFQNQR